MYIWVFGFSYFFLYFFSSFIPSRKKPRQLKPIMGNIIHSIHWLYVVGHALLVESDSHAARPDKQKNTKETMEIMRRTFLFILSLLLIYFISITFLIIVLVYSIFNRLFICSVVMV